ncbi:MAG: type III-A CRISPR-associated protein Cas10/Csm1 [Oscillatoriales cyanobacterium CG2_30_44_21]|nr:MAG: type III-A CRISPR-associated protein Cas10/Csm1 [Oscillatoriales cyanobacterium CG2_30_44_21]
MTNSNKFNQIALEVFQGAIADLLGENLPDIYKLTSEENKIIVEARKLLGLDREVNTLSLLFDRIKLPDGKGADRNHYVPLHEIVSNSEGYPNISYPIEEQPSQTDLQNYQARIADEIKIHLNSNDRWNDLSFLTFILEKYGSCVSYGDSHTALIDAARMTGAVAVALSQNQGSYSKPEFHFVAGSLSGIQDFIYTISSDGALKSLRARSFYLELVAEEIVQQILDELKLPRTNVIYAGGGNLFILAGGLKILEDGLKNIQDKFNKWLLDTFQGKIFFSLDFESCDVQDIGSSKFRECWNKAIAKLAIQKNRKFINQINQGSSKLLATKNSYQPCKVCHRDDTDDLKPLNKHESESALACPSCRDMFRLGDQLPDTSAIFRTKQDSSDGAKYSIKINGFYYHLFEAAKLILIPNSETETVYWINNWETTKYTKGSTVLMLMGRYYQEITKNEFPRAEELAANAQGISRVGYLRMDVDRLGQIFARGLPDKKDSPRNIDEYSLPRVASLSRQMSYFFKVYLNSLAGDRVNNLPEKVETLTIKSDKNFSRRNLMFIYAGGDDLFISGAWNEVVEFAFDIYQSFRAYTGNHPDITISGGISIDDAKFPLYQSADSSGDAESKAKNNGRDSLGLFGQAFKWEEWLGNQDIQVESIDSLIKAREYIKTKEELKLFGVLATAKAIQTLLKSDVQVSRNFTRNLLATAQIQEQKIEEFGDKRTVKQYDNQDKDIRYFLHLPKIAYTLARLPDRIRSADEFTKISTSLKSPYNAPYFRAIATWIELLNRGGTNQ